MEYDRSILVLDGEEGELQSLALELIRREYSVHYANDGYEAQLLAQDEKDVLGAVLLSSSIDLSEIPGLAKRFGLKPACFVPSGSQPVNTDIEKLHRDGVRWHLWDEPSDQAIRFVLSSVLSEQDPFEIRFYLRVPVELSGQLCIETAKVDVSLRDICLGGACLVGAIKASEGDTGKLAFDIDDSKLELPVRIAWATSDTGDGVNIMGVTFTEVEPEAGQVIDRLVDQLLGRHRIKELLTKPADPVKSD